MRGGSVEEFAEGIPGGALTGLERFVFGESLGVAKKITDLDERGGVFGSYAAMGQSVGDGAVGMAEIRGGGGSTGKRSKFANEIILAGGAKSVPCA